MKAATAISAAILLVSCSAIRIPISAIPLNNIAADETERLAKDPDLYWYLRMRAVPQNELEPDWLYGWRYKIDIKRLHDRASGEPIGYFYGLQFKHAIPFYKTRPVPTPTP